VALPREEYYSNPREGKPMDKKQHHLTIVFNADISERIEMAAHSLDIPVDQLLEEVLDKELPMVQKIHNKRERKPISPEGVARLMQLRDQILEEHGGIPFEKSVENLHQERLEREKELGLS
jgi:hypothetical protein